MSKLAEQLEADAEHFGLFGGDRKAIAKTLQQVADRIRKLEAEVEQFENHIEKMLYVYRAATNGTALISNQGQALDGYSELANYRGVMKSFLEAQERDVWVEGKGAA